MMVRCRGLQKTYEGERGPVDAVRGVDIDIPSGAFTAIIGRSGSGKSSLLAMIGGLGRPSGGEVNLGGVSIWSMPDDALTRFRNRRIGHVFQSASLLPTLTILDNVALPALLADPSDRAAAYGFAEHLLGRMGIGGHLDAYPEELSVGEQRRASIARALVNAPPLLLADEPTSDLDEESEREIMAVLESVNRDHATTVVLVTHDLALAARADAVIHVANGGLA